MKYVTDVCGAGSYSQDGMSPCVACPQHHYQNRTGNTTCIECPPGMSTEMDGADNASLCIG